MQEANSKQERVEWSFVQRKRKDGLPFGLTTVVKVLVPLSGFEMEKSKRQSSK